jgi:hypothetical protein
MGQHLLFRRPEASRSARHAQGTGATVRTVRIANPSALDNRVAALFDAAIEMWPWKFDPRRPTTTTIVSATDKHRPRR